MTNPIDERLNAVSANITVEPVELSSSSHAKAVGSKSACHYLGGVTEKTDGRRCRAATLLVEVHGN